jgi:outer membrane protein assembly factor BamB
MNKHKVLMFICATLVVLFSIMLFLIPIKTNTLTCVAWKYATSSYLHHQPVLYKDTLLIAAPKIIYAIDKNSGQCQWKTPLNGIVKEISTVIQDVFYIAMKETLRPDNLILHQDEISILAISPSDGKLLWKNTVSCSNVAIIPHHEGVAIGNLMFLNRTDGSIRWINTFNEYQLPNETNHKNSIITPSYNKVFCLDVENGFVLWKNQIDDLIISYPIIDDDRFIIISEKGSIFCFDKVTGSLLWRYNTGITLSGHPTISQGKLYISGGKDDPSVSCFNMKNGMRIWTYYTEAEGTSSPFVADGKVYVGAHERKNALGSSFHDLYCIDAENGKMIWRYDTKALIWSKPFVENGNIFFSSLDKNVYRLEEEAIYQKIRK